MPAKRKRVYTPYMRQKKHHARQPGTASGQAGKRSDVGKRASGQASRGAVHASPAGCAGFDRASYDGLAFA